MISPWKARQVKPDCATDAEWNDWIESDAASLLPGAPASFLRRLSPGESGCLLWQGARHLRGYGAARVNGKNGYAHRFAWSFANGEIPPGMFVCHRCDNPPCVNPSHLWLGTHQDNVDDMRSKGRGALGAKNPQSKLTEDDVRRMHRLYQMETLPRGMIKHIARDFGISQTQTARILKGKRWERVYEELYPDAPGQAAA